jgi:hypothetical protein
MAVLARSGRQSLSRLSQNSAMSRAPEFPPPIVPPVLALLRPLVALAAFASMDLAALAADCAFRPAPRAALAGVSAAANYRPVLKQCVAADGRRATAIRTMTIGGEDVALLADPEALTAAPE